MPLKHMYFLKDKLDWCLIQCLVIGPIKISNRWQLECRQTFCTRGCNFLSCIPSKEVIYISNSIFMPIICLKLSVPLTTALPSSVWRNSCCSAPNLQQQNGGAASGWPHGSAAMHCSRLGSDLLSQSEPFVDAHHNDSRHFHLKVNCYRL